MPRKGKKKNVTPILVAPEPQGDELEADMLWDSVQEINDKPFFMDGSVLDATRAAFEGEKFYNNIGESAKTAFIGKPRYLKTLRARERFLETEQELKKKIEEVKDLKTDAKNFESLRENEEKESQRERENVTKTVLDMMTEISDSRLTILEDMEDLADNFFAKQSEILNNLCLIAAKDVEIEAAFNEQLTMREKFHNSEESYFREHGEHVLNMAKEQEETKRQQNEMLESMMNRLETGVNEMTKLSVEELEDSTAQKEEISQLIVELLKLQKQSGVLEKKTTAMAELQTSLQRMIDLEIQKHELCIQRQQQLKNELKKLSNEVKVNNEKLLKILNNTTPSAAYTSTLPMVSTSPNTIANLTDSENEKSLAILTIEAGRELESANAELAGYKKKLWELRRHHLVQLSGQYQPINIDDSSLRTTQDFFLDAETSAAVRSVVVEALLEISQCLEPSNNLKTVHSNIDQLLSLTNVEERKAIQDYVAKRINKLFSCLCPTSPPLLFLREAANVQSEM